MGRAHAARAGSPSARGRVALFGPRSGSLGSRAIDLVTGGNSHFTRSVLHADSEGNLIETITRRYRLAFSQFERGLMPFLTGSRSVAVAGCAGAATLFAVRGLAPWQRGLRRRARGVGRRRADQRLGPAAVVFGMIMAAFMTLYCPGRSRGTREEGLPAGAGAPVAKGSDAACGRLRPPDRARRRRGIL